MSCIARIGSIEAAPGQKARGFLPVAGTDVRMPLTLINGVDEGPTLLITAGIHGGEYPSIEAAIRLSVELEPSEVSGLVIVIPIVSPEAFHARQQYVLPADGKNVNRQFPGRALGTVSERIAYTIASQVVGFPGKISPGGEQPRGQQVDAWIDLHGGDIHEELVPVAGYLEEGAVHVRERARAMAEVFGIEHLIHPKDLPGTTFKMAAARGIPCIIAEAGQCGQLDEESVAILTRGCRSVAQLLRILPGNPAPARPHMVFPDYPWVRAEHSGCWYPAVRIGAAVRRGQCVGVVKDYFGVPIAEYTAPADGIILLLTTSLAMNAGDPIFGLGIA